MNQPRRHSRRKNRSFGQRLLAYKRLLLPIALVLIAGLGAGAYFVVRGQASPEERIANARQLEQSGDHKGAAIELKNALQQAPDNAEARFLLGRSHFANNDFLNAEKEFRKALNAGYQQPELHFLLGRTLLLIGEAQKVIDEIDELPGAPATTNAGILSIRAQAQRLLGDKTGMEASLNRAELYSPEHPDVLAVRAGLAYGNGEPAAALALIEKALGKEGQRADFWVMKGDLLRAEKQMPTALAAYAQAIKINPSNLPARLATAQHYLSSSDLDKAEAELKTLLAHAPNNMMGRYLSALIDFRRKNYEQANGKLQEVLRGGPDFVPANLLAGIINLQLGKRENAITHLNRVIDRVPNHALARKLLASAMMQTGQVDRAKELIANLKADDNDALLLSLQGNIALRKGQYQDARTSLEKALALAPDDPALIKGLAASRLASGDETGAIEAMTQLAESDSNTAHQAEVLLVMTHVKSKRYDEAMKVVDKLENRHPKLALAENLRGAIHLANNAPAKARANFEKALSIDPGYLPAASNLARLDLADKDIKTARIRFEQVIKHNAKNARAYLALAELAAMEKNEAEYVKQLEQAKKADPKNAMARNLIINYWLAKRDHGKALLEARAALDNTGSKEFLNHLGTVQLRQGDTANALASFSKWAEANPLNPLAFYRLAQVQSLSKDRASALKSLDKALALHPEFAEASLQKALLLGQEGRRDEAVKIARELQNRAPKAAAGYLAEAEVLFADKRFLPAGKLFAKAAELSGEGRLQSRAFQSYVAAGQSTEGEKLLQQWLQAHPNGIAQRHELAQSQLSGKRLREAAENYRLILRTNPKDLIAHNNLAWLLGELKDPEALKISEQAVNLAPNNPAVLDTHGWQLSQAGQFKQAIPYLQKALKLASDSLEIRWHLATTLVKAGDKNAAIMELDRLLSSQETFPQANEARALLTQLRQGDH